MNSLENILTDLFAIEPSLKEKEPQVRSLVAAMLKAKPDTQFDQTFANKLKAQLLATPEEPATRRAWYLSVPAWSLASVSTAALLIAVVAQLDLQHTQPTTTVYTNGKSALPATHLAPQAFGALTFASTTPTGAERGGEGTGKMIAEDWTPTIYEYVLPENWADNLTLPTEAPVYAMGRSDIGLDLSTAVNLPALRDLNLSVHNLNAENSKENISASYDAINNAVSIFFNNTSSQPLEDIVVAPSEETLIAQAREHAARYGFDLSNTADPIVDQQSLMLFARTADDTSVPAYPVTVIFRQRLNDLPVYWSGETRISLHPTTGELTSITAPYAWQPSAASTYRTITNTTQLATFFRWGGTVDPATWYPEQNATRQQVQLEQPKLIYSYQNICNESAACVAYLVPSLSARTVATESQPWANEVIIPLSTNQP